MKVYRGDDGYYHHQKKNRSKPQDPSPKLKQFSFSTNDGLYSITVTSQNKSAARIIACDLIKLRHKISLKPENLHLISI